MNRYFISDPHFGHGNILKFERTRFATIEEHDAYIIEQVNKVVRVTDTLYILGDLGNLEKVRLLNGRKILIMGNHDKRGIGEYLGYFAEVYDTPIYLTKRVLLSHEPVMVNTSVLDVHGHLHGSILDNKNYLNISLEQINYKPITEHELYRIAATLPKENTNFLQEWYADQYLITARSRKDVLTDDNGKIKLQESIEFRANAQKDSKGFVIDVFEELKSE